MDDLKGLGRLVNPAVESSPVLVEGFIVGIQGIVFHGGHNRGFVDKPGDIVDVAVGVIANDSFAEPKDFSNPEKRLQSCLDFFLAERGIPVWIQEAGLGCHEESLAVDVNGTALQHHTGLEDGQIAELSDLAGNVIVAIKRGVFFAPGVVVPIHDEFFCLLSIGEKDGAVVPAPGLIGRMMMEVNTRMNFWCEFEPVARLGFHLGIPDIDEDAFGSGECLDQFTKGLIDTRTFPRKTIAVLPRP